ENPWPEWGYRNRKTPPARFRCPLLLPAKPHPTTKAASQNPAVTAIETNDQKEQAGLPEDRCAFAQKRIPLKMRKATISPKLSFSSASFHHHQLAFFQIKVKIFKRGIVLNVLLVIPIIRQT